MGRRKIERLTKMAAEEKHCRLIIRKRKRAILKKMIELSVISGLKMFLVMLDEEGQRATHFSTDTHFNILDVFNTPYHREFFTNTDFEKVGGQLDELDCRCFETGCWKQAGSKGCDALKEYNLEWHQSKNA